MWMATKTTQSCSRAFDVEIPYHVSLEHIIISPDQVGVNFCCITGFIEYCFKFGIISRNSRLDTKIDWHICPNLI